MASNGVQLAVECENLRRCIESSDIVEPIVVTMDARRVLETYEWLEAENKRIREVLDRWLHAHDHYLAGRFPRRCVACARLADFVTSHYEGSSE